MTLNKFTLQVEFEYHNETGNRVHIVNTVHHLLVLLTKRQFAVVGQLRNIALHTFALFIS